MATTRLSTRGIIYILLRSWLIKWFKTHVKHIGGYIGHSQIIRIFDSCCSFQTVRYFDKWLQLKIAMVNQEVSDGREKQFLDAFSFHGMRIDLFFFWFSVITEAVMFCFQKKLQPTRSRKDFQLTVAWCVLPFCKCYKCRKNDRWEDA